MTHPVESALPVPVSVRTYVIVSPGAGPTVAVPAAPPAPGPVKMTPVGPTQPLPGFVIVTPVTLYDPLDNPADGDVLTSAVGGGVHPVKLTVGGGAGVAPSVMLTKATRFSDGFEVCERLSAGVAVIVTTAVAVRGVGSYVSTTEPVLIAELTPEGTPLVEMVTLMVIEAVVPGVNEPMLNVTVGLLM